MDGHTDAPTRSVSLSRPEPAAVGRRQPASVIIPTTRASPRGGLSVTCAVSLGGGVITDDDAPRPVWRAWNRLQQTLALLARSVRVDGGQMDRVWARGRVPGQAECRTLWEPRSEYLTCIGDSRRDPRGSMIYRDLSACRNWAGQRQAGVFRAWGLRQGGLETGPDLEEFRAGGCSSLDSGGYRRTRSVCLTSGCPPFPWSSDEG